MKTTKRNFLSLAMPFLSLQNSIATTTGNNSNRHKYVDLGLSVKWATCNVGAETPEEYGEYYAWGEVTTKECYTDENCKTYGKQMNSIAGNPTFDVARKKWGGKWRLPTKAEFQELIDKCLWTWTKFGEHFGYKVTSKENGNSIFMPAAGWHYYGETPDFQGSCGHYWSATPREGQSTNADYFRFSEGSRVTGWHLRENGLAVRPVCE